MCRIAGFWDFNYRGDYHIEEVAIAMRDTLSHGGPDDAGIFLEKSKGLALTHRRLSILDLSPSGHQPMEFDNLVIVYNGEVYNFREIRQELEKDGYSFTSTSDTEVVLKAFHRWGLDTIHKFIGMFAFTIWDKKERILVLCRDRIGVKPLYWYYEDGLFMFSSELKAFHKHPKFRKELNIQALSLYLQYGYITAPYSIFENTYKLKPGHFLTINGSGEIEEIQYWDVKEFYIRGVKEAEKWKKRKEEEIAEELEDILKNSFKLRLVSDVPVGIFLSGGIDSTTVTALLQKETGAPLKTFTIGFYEKEYNEANYAKEIAKYLGTDHVEFYCTPKEAFDIIPMLPQIYDEPFGDSSSIPTYLVSKLAVKSVKVALSADGGDEQFCGYTRYWMIKKINRIISYFSLFAKALELISPEYAFKIYTFFKPILPKWTNFRDKYIKFINVLKAEDLFNHYDISNKYFLPQEFRQLGLKSWIEKNQVDMKEITLDPLTFMMFYDMKTYLPDDILVKVDRATMSVSLEGREPLLDHRIVEFTCQLPPQMKYRDGISKYLLRKILYKLSLQNLLKDQKWALESPYTSGLKEN